MGRQANPVRMSDKIRNGKPVPWHESDTFEAKILRGWAERRRKSDAARAKNGTNGSTNGTNGAAKPAPTDGTDFDFGHNEPAAPAAAPDDDKGIGF
jgi:hypothetical protein